METNQPTQAKGVKVRKEFGSRQQQIFGFIGMVLFLTGLVATGLLGQFNLITIIMCLLGIAVGSIVFLPRVTGNLTVYANMFMYSLFFCAAAVVFFMILQKHPITFDATKSRNFSLSRVTSNFMKRLDQPIRATVFVANKQDRISASLLLGEYSRYSPNFNYEIVDPFQETAVAQRFAATVMPGEVYLERLTTGTQQAERIVKVNDLNEEQVTNGIVQLIRGKDINVYFTTGHGEPELKEDKISAALLGQGPDPNNLQSLADQLERAYIRSVPLALDRMQSVPVDASVVVIVRPRIDFQAGEARVLRTYLEQGGRVLFLLNPDIPQVGNEVRTTLVNIASIIKDFGIQLPHEAVVMPLAQQSNQSVYLTPVIAKEHRITQGFSDKEPFMIFDQARPVVAGTPPANSYVETFLVSADQAWPFPIEELQRSLLTRQDPKVAPKMDELRSLPLGVASTRLSPSRGEEGAGKIVVIGNGTFATSRYFGNSEWQLFMNSINWLTDSGELIAIPSSKIEVTPSILTPGQSRFLFILVVIAVPTLIAFGGLGYSISRRGTLQ